MHVNIVAHLKLLPLYPGNKELIVVQAIVTREGIPYYWFFVRRIHLSAVDYPHRDIYNIYL